MLNIQIINYRCKIFHIIDLDKNNLIIISLQKTTIMGLFDRIKSQRDIAKEEIKEVPWHMLTKMSQLDEIVTESKSKPVAIFKHSTSCGISRMVLKNFEKDYSLNDDQLKIYFLDLKEYRDISSEIASRFKVTHESPQMIVIKNESVVHHDSHQSIDAGHLSKLI